MISVLQSYRAVAVDMYTRLVAGCTLITHYYALQEHSHAITLAAAAAQIAQHLQTEAKLIRKQLLQQRDDRITVSLPAILSRPLVLIDAYINA
jgi:hypothetical protein